LLALYLSSTVIGGAQLQATNISYKTVTRDQLQDLTYQNNLVKFLFNSLEQYRDPEQDIKACLDYILDDKHGGYVFVAEDEKKNLKGVVFLANTNMKLFVPEYLLVYIATDKNERGKGIGKNLMLHATSVAKAPVALHVEHDNPAKKLYEKIGFTNKYTEMRWYP
jgi:[ribosomal protein S18]-alanine N-acetyltransferase